MPGPDPFITDLRPDDQVAVQRGGARVWILGSDIRALGVPELRVGLASVTKVSTRIVFAVPMATADYQVFLFPQGQLTAWVAIWPDRKSTAGFYINTGSVITIDMSYLVMGNT